MSAIPNAAHHQKIHQKQNPTNSRQLKNSNIHTMISWIQSIENSDEIPTFNIQGPPRPEDDKDAIYSGGSRFLLDKRLI